MSVIALMATDYGISVEVTKDYGIIVIYCQKIMVLGQDTG